MLGDVGTTLGWFALVLGAALIAVPVSSALLRRSAWAKVARKHGLKLVDGDIYGRLDGSDVVAECSYTGFWILGDSHFTRVQVGGDLPADLEIEKRGPDPAHGEVQVADPDFNRVAKVRGESLFVQTLLDEHTRRYLRVALESGWSYREGAWSYEVGGRLFHSIDDRLADGVGLAKVLRDATASIAPRFAERVRRDAVSGARLAALAYLIERHPRTVSLTRALQDALGDENGEVRLLAATVHADVATLVALLAGWLAGDGGEVRLAAIRALGKVGSSAVVPRLAPLHERTVDASLDEASLAGEAIAQIRGRV